MSIISFREWVAIQEEFKTPAQKKFQQEMEKTIEKSLGADKDRAAAEVDPKVVINKSLLQVAKQNPAAAAQALNKDNNPLKMKKK